MSSPSFGCSSLRSTARRGQSRTRAVLNGFIAKDDVCSHVNQVKTSSGFSSFFCGSLDGGFDYVALMINPASASELIAEVLA